MFAGALFLFPQGGERVWRARMARGGLVGYRLVDGVAIWGTDEDVAGELIKVLPMLLATALVAGRGLWH